MGIKDLDSTLEHSDLVNSDDCLFVGTGITDSIVMQGVKLEKEGGFKTESLLLSGFDKITRLIKTYYS